MSEVIHDGCDAVCKSNSSSTGDRWVPEPNPRGNYETTRHCTECGAEVRLEVGGVGGPRLLNGTDSEFSFATESSGSK